MPDVDKLTRINLDDSKFVDNTDKTNSVFLYFTYPNTDCKFTNMVTEKDGTYLNVLNYQYPSNATNLYVSQNKNFTDLDEYKATSFSITQKIHTTTRITKGTSGDLEVIIQHVPSKSTSNNYAPKDAKLFLVLYLTPDSSSTAGGDLETVFKNIKPDNLLTQTNNFETANLSSSIMSIALDGAIQGQFGKDATNTSNQPSNLCFMYMDNNKNPIVIMRSPIPIAASNFQTIQQYMTLSKKQIDTNLIFNGSTDFIPVADPNTITTNILMKSKNDLANDVKNNPNTPAEQVEAKDDKATEARTKDAEKTNTSEKAGFTVREGAKTMRCRPSDSNNAPIASLVSGKDPMSGSATMQFLINAILFIGITLGMYMFAPGFYASLATLNDNKFLMGIPLMILGSLDNFDARVARISLIYWIIGIIAVVLFIILWSVGLSDPPAKKKIPDRDRNFMIVFGFLFLSICILNTAFLKMTNGSLQLAKLVVQNMDPGDKPDASAITKSLNGVFKDTPIYWFYSGPKST
jgi:hypothetical protein